MTASTTGFVAVAGAAGEMGRLIVAELSKLGVPVKALVRPGTSRNAAKMQPLLDLKSKQGNGARGDITICEADLSNVSSLATHLAGAKTVVSTLQGLRPVLITTQTSLLDAAIAAQVPRFIPSDYSLDFTKTRPGTNRNLDLHREFHAVLASSAVKSWTTVLNGAFMDIIIPPVGLVDPGKRRIAHAGDKDMAYDFTTMRDTAAYTARVAADPEPTPQILRIAGDTISPRELAEAATRASASAAAANKDPVSNGSSNKPYTTFWMGSVGFFEAFVIPVLRFFVGGVEDQQVPIWQGMQYMANMASGEGKLEPLDNDRYPGLEWTKAEDFLKEHFVRTAAGGDGDSK